MLFRGEAAIGANAINCQFFENFADSPLLLSFSTPERSLTVELSSPEFHLFFHRFRPLAYQGELSAVRSSIFQFIFTDVSSRLRPR